jgi:pimeloyl-ACP methyl ester carboxylesterase
VISNGAIRRDAAKFIKGIDAGALQAAAPKLKSFDRPVLITWAADDRFFKIELGKRLAAAFPNARFEVIDDSRTFVPEDQPDRLAELIAAFAREPAATAA